MGGEVDAELGSPIQHPAGLSATMRKTNLSARIKALEGAARCPEPCTYEQHRDLLLEIPVT